MPRTTLTVARVEALRPRKTPCDIRDAKLRGFGVWTIAGDAGTMRIEEARASAVETLAAIRRGGDAPHRPNETLFEAVAA